MHHDPKSYLAIIERSIARKTFKTMRKSLALGKKDARKLHQPFCDFFFSSSKNIVSAKVDCIGHTLQKLIEETLEKNPSMIIPMVLKLFKNISEHTDVELTAHPKDADVIKKSLHEITMACVSARKIIIIEDDSFKRGSLVIKANKSIIDAQITTQIANAKELLLEDLSG